EGLKILLVFQIAIAGEKDIEFGLRQPQQCTVFDTCPSHLGDGSYKVRANVIFQFSREALVKQDSHIRASASRCLICSNSSRACSRRTVGKSSKNSSSECPPAT